MSGSVETRRFRTWESDVEAAPARAWRIVFKYGLLRVLRAWHMRLLLVLSLIFAVIMLGTYSYTLADVPTGPDGEAVTAATASILLPTIAFLLFVGAPMFSEDLRFNAPLFYFSKPVTARDYVLGKGSLLTAILAVTALLPFLIFLGFTLVGALTAQPLRWDGTPLSGDALVEWDQTHLNSFQDWLYVTVSVLPGLFVYMVFLASLFVAMSAWTQRAWHAAIGAVAVFGGWSILGLTASEVSNTALGDAFGPLGWFQVMVVAPVEVRFGFWQSYRPTTPEYLTQLGTAIPLTYTMVIGATVLCWLATHWRLRRMEGIL